jgi:hypothetical protein
MPTTLREIEELFGAQASFDASAGDSFTELPHHRNPDPNPLLHQNTITNESSNYFSPHHPRTNQYRTEDVFSHTTPHADRAQAQAQRDRSPLSRLRQSELSRANMSPSVHSGFRSESSMSPDLANYGSDIDENELQNTGIRSSYRPSSGGFSPPAWRRGWNEQTPRKGGQGGGGGGQGLGVLGADREAGSRYASREATPDYASADEGDMVAYASRVRLPTGSLSPEKQRSPSPERDFAAIGVKREQAERDLASIPEEKNDGCEST